MVKFWREFIANLKNIYGIVKIWRTLFASSEWISLKSINLLLFVK
jgi:hypothetical protein